MSNALVSITIGRYRPLVSGLVSDHGETYPSQYVLVQAFGSFFRWGRDQASH